MIAFALAFIDSGRLLDGVWVYPRMFPWDDRFLQSTRACGRTLNPSAALEPKDYTPEAILLSSQYMTAMSSDQWKSDAQSIDSLV